MRKAASLADDALEVAYDLFAPGVPELELFAGMHSAIFRGRRGLPGGAVDYRVWGEGADGETHHGARGHWSE